MPLTGYLKFPDIAGESVAAEHEDEIDVHGLRWSIRQTKAAQVGRGRTRGRAKVDSLVVSKFTDASSVYLALANLQGKSFPEVVLAVRKDSGEAHLDYLIITMTNVVIVGFEMENEGIEDTNLEVLERVSLMFERIEMKYTVQAADHSAGDEHEISYDIAAGA